MNTKMPETRFFAHGEYSISSCNSHLFVVASGAWNAEAKQAVHYEIISAINYLKRSSWHLIVDITDFELGTPDFQEAGLIGKCKLIELGLQKVVYINKGNKQAGYRQIQAMQPNSNKYAWRLLNSARNAERWLSK